MDATLLLVALLAVAQGAHGAAPQAKTQKFYHEGFRVKELNRAVEDTIPWRRMKPHASEKLVVRRHDLKKSHGKNCKNGKNGKNGKEDEDDGTIIELPESFDWGDYGLTTKMLNQHIPEVMHRCLYRQRTREGGPCD